MRRNDPGNPFVFSLGEFSGALADLGVMLPLILALISLNGMDATAVFVGVGLAYLLVAFTYRLPIPVQPLKSVSAVALAMGLAPVVIVTGAIWNAVAFLGMGLAGLDRWVQKAFPKPVVRGIQLGLAWLLFKSAWTLVNKTPEAWQGGYTFSGQMIAWLWSLGRVKCRETAGKPRWSPDTPIPKATTPSAARSRFQKRKIKRKISAPPTKIHNQSTI